MKIEERRGFQKKSLKPHRCFSYWYTQSEAGIVVFAAFKACHNFDIEHQKYLGNAVTYFEIWLGIFCDKVVHKEVFPHQTVS